MNEDQPYTAEYYPAKRGIRPCKIILTRETDDYRPQLLMDEEDWQAAFEPYEDHPSDAQTLGCKLGMLRAYQEPTRYQST